MLRDIIAEPTRPLALGRHEEEDLVDLLLRLIPNSEGALRKALTICLLCYDDPRTADFMAHTFPLAQDAETVLHLGQRLAHKGVDFFRPFLWQRKTAQALAAARVCRQTGGLEPRDQLRVAILLEGDNPIPEMGDVWLEELAGPHRAKARQLAETLGEQVLWLWSVPLPEAETHWLLELTRRYDPTRARQETERLLEAGWATLPLLEIALQLEVSLPKTVLACDDAEVRAIGIRVGLADDCLERYLAPAASPEEAVAALRRCGPEVQLDLLGDHRWEVRAASVQALANLSERPLERVRALVGCDSLGQRVAAVTLLESWGDLPWLEEWLRASGQAED